MKLPKLTSSAMRILEPAETWALAVVVDERYRGMILAAARGLDEAAADRLDRVWCSAAVDAAGSGGD